MELREWFLLNLQLVKCVFNDKQVLHDSEDFTWLLVEDFDLPSGWRPLTSNLLMRFSGLKGSIQSPPNYFYLDKGLRHRNGKGQEHYFESDGFNDLSIKGYARFSLHLRGWKPSADVISGDNWLTCINALYQALKDAGD